MDILIINNDHSVPTKVLATTRYMNEKMTQPLYLCKGHKKSLLTGKGWRERGEMKLRVRFWDDIEKCP